MDVVPHEVDGEAVVVEGSEVGGFAFAEGVVVGRHIPLAEIVHYQRQVSEGVVSADIGRSPVAVEREVVESVVFVGKQEHVAEGNAARADVALGVV